MERVSGRESERELKDRENERRESAERSPSAHFRVATRQSKCSISRAGSPDNPPPTGSPSQPGQASSISPDSCPISTASASDTETHRGHMETWHTRRGGGGLSLLLTDSPIHTHTQKCSFPQPKKNTHPFKLHKCTSSACLSEEPLCTFTLN